VENLEHASPLVDAVNALLAPLGIHAPNYLVFCALVPLIVLVVGLLVRTKLSVDNPGRFQIVLEDITTFIVEQLDAAIGPGKGRKFMPLCGGIFVFILIANLMGQIPGLGSPTTNINVAAGCALTVWLYYHWQGIRAQGLGKYLAHFAFPPGIPKAMFILMIFIEPISHLSRVLSLTVRLFGNMFAEHLVVLVIASIVPFVVPLPFQALGLVVGPLQAFIFMLLTAIYLSAAVAVDEHH
jgi:F-type H+-transporting ATPase subunit a